MKFVVLSSCIVFVCMLMGMDVASSPLQPYNNYSYSTEIQADLADLWWTVDQAKKEITFELHMKTSGWVAMGISPAGGMKGADIGLGWVDSAGQLHFEDRYAYGKSQPVQDNTTSNWIGLQGREENGWTAIQFKRALDTCDPMDFPIKSGTNILIFAYGLEDPEISDGKATISYHGNRRFTRIIPLRSYGNPSKESKFDGLDYFDFQLKNYQVPAADTTYHCKVYKVPATIRERRHAIAHKTLVDPANRDLVHHLLLHECDPDARFDDNNLPDGLCDDIEKEVRACSANIATGWAVGGDDIVEFPQVAGYPVGGDFEIKYYLIQMHYDNPHRMSNRTDNSGLRFYLGRERRQYELGYLTLGTATSFLGITIPPRVDRFIIDSYCPKNGTKRLPSTGITVFGAFPHTHLQGVSIWTKIIRKGKAERYLFNADAYDFNYQFENRLPEPIQLYPGDELATRCVYSTTNKNQTTLGGEATKDEMCLHMLSYYPRVNNLYSCLTGIAPPAWTSVANVSMEQWNFTTIYQWLMQREWTPASASQWQDFFHKAPRMAYIGRAGDYFMESIPKIPEYEDLKSDLCQSTLVNRANHQDSFLFLSLFLFSSFIRFAFIY